jgi:hypothetical protein
MEQVAQVGQVVHQAQVVLMVALGQVEQVAQVELRAPMGQVVRVAQVVQVDKVEINIYQLQAIILT